MGPPPTMKVAALWVSVAVALSGCSESVEAPGDASAVTDCVEEEAMKVGMSSEEAAEFCSDFGKE